jgi:hypothetical protein
VQAAVHLTGIKSTGKTRVCFPQDTAIPGENPRLPRMALTEALNLKTALAADERRLTQTKHAIEAPGPFTRLVGW